MLALFQFRYFYSFYHAHRHNSQVDCILLPYVINIELLFDTKNSQTTSTLTRNKLLSLRRVPIICMCKC